MTYCVVPQRLARKLHGTLERHFRDHDSVTVIVDRRGAERRGQGDRRTTPLAVWAVDTTDPTERRRIRNAGARRVDERRPAMRAPSDPKPLPRAARRHDAPNPSSV